MLDIFLDWSGRYSKKRQQWSRENACGEVERVKRVKIKAVTSLNREEDERNRGGSWAGWNAISERVGKPSVSSV
jgi:hypothetical protein